MLVAPVNQITLQKKPCMARSTCIDGHRHWLLGVLPRPLALHGLIVVVLGGQRGGDGVPVELAPVEGVLGFLGLLVRGEFHKDAAALGV